MNYPLFFYKINQIFQDIEAGQPWSLVTGLIEADLLRDPANPIKAIEVEDFIPVWVKAGRDYLTLTIKPLSATLEYQSRTGLEENQTDKSRSIFLPHNDVTGWVRKVKEDEGWDLPVITKEWFWVC